MPNKRAVEDRRHDALQFSRRLDELVLSLSTLHKAWHARSEFESLLDPEQQSNASRLAGSTAEGGVPASARAHRYYEKCKRVNDLVLETAKLSAWLTTRIDCIQPLMDRPDHPAGGRFSTQLLLWLKKVANKAATYPIGVPPGPGPRWLEEAADQLGMLAAKLQAALDIADIEDGSGNGSNPSPIDTSKWWLIGQFDAELHNRIYQACKPGRKKKKVARKKRSDNLYLYSVDDVRANWPDDFHRLQPGSGHPPVAPRH